MKSVVKAGIIGLLALAMLIPVQLVRSLVKERMERRDRLIEQMSQVWGSRQTIMSVALTQKDSALLPDEITIAGTLTPDIRKKGIFTLPFYESRLAIKGSFKNDAVMAGYRRLTLKLSDTAGVTVRSALWGPGRIGCPSWTAGKDSIVIQVPEKSGAASFEIDLAIKGIDSLLFMPLARKTTIHLTSPWGDPNFTGALLPATREISGAGFDATWTVEMLKQPAAAHTEAFGVNLFIPVDTYTLTDRATKYAILFITLTFVAFFLFEVMNQIRIHPFQYLLVGLALSIFYLLLLSLSEHIGFTWSYAIATVAVVGLVTVYCHQALHSVRRAALTGTLITVLYLLLFVLLRLETYALLIGSLGLFAMLAAIMFMTRSVDWYALPGDLRSVDEG